MVLRVMFDTNAYDAILAAGDLPLLQEKIAAGELSIVTTPIQEDEIRQIRNRTRQRALLDLHRALSAETIEPSNAIEDDITYMSRDEMLARIAAKSCDLLVTNDKALRNDARLGARAIDYAGFAQRIGLRG
jgi:rRNA-processing protein FCF1